MLNVPFDNINVPEFTKALLRVQVPPTPSNVGPAIDSPLVDIVFDVVALKVGAKLDDQVPTVPEESAKLPEIAIVELPLTVNVTTPAETVKSLQANAPVQVTVYVPTWSKNTSSNAVGTDAPLAPPDEVAQLVVLDVVQLPAPPTQYLAKGVTTHPVFPLTFILVFELAFHVAPPVAVLS